MAFVVVVGVCFFSGNHSKVRVSSGFQVGRNLPDDLGFETSIPLLSCLVQ